MSSGAQTPAEYAFWRTPDAAITVVYSLALFHEIDFVVNEGYRRIPHGGVEVGGLLFGRKESARIRLEAFRGIECEHAFGPSFVLSDRDIDTIQIQLATFRTDGDLEGLEPVGWFVAHSRSALEMSDREISWFDRFFPEPRNVAVLVKPERFQATRFTFVVRRHDGRLQRAAATEAIILPLSGRARGPQDGQSEDGLIPSMLAPATPAPARAAAPPSQTAGPAKPPESPPEPVPPVVAVPPPQPAESAVLASPPPEVIEPAEPVPPSPSLEPFPALTSAQATDQIAPAPEPLPEPIPPLPSVPPSPEPVAASSVVPQAPPPAAKSSGTPPRTVPPHGIDTRPLAPPPPASVPPKLPERPQTPPKWPAVPKPASPPAASPPSSVAREHPAGPPLQDETVEMPRIPVPAAQEPKPATQTDQIWRQRVEALPLRPAPPPPAIPKSPQIAREPGTTTRGLEAPSSARPRLTFMFLIAALLGCSVGYYAYLQLPPPVIPLTVRPQGGSLVVTWPAAQTEHVTQATLQIGPSQPVLLSPAERSTGQAAVAANGNDIKIELVAHHWPRDSRGIVRFVRSAGTPAAVQ